MYIQGLSDFVLHKDKVKILHILAETTLEEMLPTPHMSPFTQSFVEKKMQWHSGSFKNIGNSQQIMLFLETEKEPKWFRKKSESPCSRNHDSETERYFLTLQV